MSIEIIDTVADSTATTAATLSPPERGQYWPGQGGIFLMTLPALHGVPARHLLCSQDEAEALEWGGYGKEIEGAKSHVDGAANTAALMASGHEHPAAAWCANYIRDGHSDFYLPARFDMLHAHLVAPELFDKDDWYWTSTQLSAGYAFVQDFRNGHSHWDLKVNVYRVRAFRTIHLTA
jgi:hypothetical protein